MVSVRKPSQVVWVLATVVLAAVALLLVVIIRSGPDTTVTGIVTTVESHRVCVAETGHEPRCAHVDYPGTLNGIHLGDCVGMTVSAEELLVAIDRVDTCN